MPASVAPKSHHRHQTDRSLQGGFTLIEMMIVVAIIAALAAVAVIAYTGHIRKSRIVEAQEMIGQIKVQQEVYFQHHNSYISAPVHPALHTDFEPRPWKPAPAAWEQLNVQGPRNDSTYFSFWTNAFAANTAPDATATSLGLETTLPYFYVVAQGDVDSKAATQPMQLIVGSGPSRVLILNEGQ
jgi:prepilin-type N-terminal cleavage/methylation domain-containing protein